MYQTIPTHISKELNTDTLEILNQIKKQTEEISTSEASIHFLKNLSNPTNLTNPQIIGTQKTSITNTQSQSPTFRKKDISKIKKRNFYKAKSNINIIRDDLFNGQKFPNSLFKNNEIKIKVIKKDVINDALDEKAVCKTTKGKVKLEPIWNKLKNISVTQVRNRDIRINVRKNALVKDFIDNSKFISQIKYNINIKKEKLQQMKNIKEAQLSMINKTEEKISHLQNAMINDYNTNYVQYLRYLNNTIEKENQKSSDLHNNIIILKNDISKLNTRISKLIEKKFNILKWIELLIKLKEKIKSVPKYYFDILEENDFYKIYKFKDKKAKASIFYLTSFSSLVTKNTKSDKNITESQSQEITISEPNREKVLSYRYSLIFKDPEEFMLQYSKLENNWLKNIEIEHDLIKEIDKLKKKLNEFNEANFIDDEKLLEEKLKLNKNIYFQLKQQYDSLKSQNKKSIKKIQLNPIMQTKSSLSSPDIFSNIYDEMFNNLNFYNIKTFSPKKRKSSAINAYSDVSNTNLYKLILDLFNVANQNNFIKFDKSNFIKNRNTNPIFEIMNYIEIVINLLFEEKYKYLNDPKLKVKYKAAQADFFKENRKLKILKLIKLKELKGQEKLKTMKEKGIKRQYFTTRKVDYNLYKKFKLMKLNKIKEKESNKKIEEKYNEPNLEDFLYDIK